MAEGDKLVQKHSPDTNQADEHQHNLLTEFLQSAALTGIEQPYNSVGQLINHVSGHNILAPLHTFDFQSGTKLGSADWAARELGSVSGMLPLFLVTKSAVERSMSPLTQVATADSVSLLGLRLNAETYAAMQMGLAGAGYSELFQPASDNNFWAAKGKNALALGVTFGSMRWLSGKLPNPVPESSTGGLTTNLAARLFNTGKGMVAGGFGGVVNAETHALTSGQLTPSREALANKVAAYTVLGGLLSAVDSGSAAGERASGSEPARRTSSDAGTANKSAAEYDNNQGQVNPESGKYDAAVEHLHRTAQSLAQELGADHPRVATAYSDLANTYMRMGSENLPKAGAMIDRALAIREKTFGAVSDEVATTLREKSGIAVAAGDYGQAADALVKATQIWDQLAAQGKFSSADLQSYSRSRPIFTSNAINWYRLADRTHDAAQLEKGSSLAPVRHDIYPETGR